MAEQTSARPQRKMSTSGESVYKVLGLEKGASAEEIKKSPLFVFKGLASAGGPDVPPTRPLLTHHTAGKCPKIILRDAAIISISGKEEIWAKIRLNFIKLTNLRHSDYPSVFYRLLMIYF
uniref:Uncharacterized protein n=1 Tax=Fundulus heteroclitus TaxID=8078 RepID=A0A3Q2P9H4_FUNHE